MITYRELLDHIQLMPDHELDACIRVEDYDAHMERPVTRYIDEIAYNSSQELVLTTEECAIEESRNAPN